MQDLLGSTMYLLTSSPTAWTVSMLVLGLLVGSFLNVVIHRLPIMMEREWKTQAQEILGPNLYDPPRAAPVEQQPYNLVVPRSACPKCGAPITALQNIPVISYLFLRGACARCKTRISIRYPLIELFTGVVSAAVAWKFGFTWYCGAALLLTWALVALSAIDIDHQLLPDDITLPLLWLGLLLSLAPTLPEFGLPVDARSSILGAVFGYLSLWSIYKLFKLLTGKEGMGYGDFKLLAALGAWLGWQMLLLIILLSAFVGAAVGIALIVLRGRDRNIPIPFGPYLAAAGWIALMWGDRLVSYYVTTTGLK
ncbi:prepilin peptidase [Steroidobacter flavus]|uniref:Prepilin leader peptidase/N-methyltransferase n=1 Tax=Steroidobacter flavus TaxID=1842136 RepID=A0ABV8SPB7_9GAMM